MDIFGTLVATIGPVISKSIIRYWFKDESIVVDAASNIIDVIKQKVEDIRTARKVARQMEEVQDRILQSLVPLFEFENLPDYEKKAVMLQVATTLNKAVIDPELLAEHDLDPQQLFKYLCECRPEKQAIRDLSEAGTALYRRIIKESSSIIIDIGSELPRFQEGILKILLQRDQILIDSTGQILDQITRIREESLRANPELDSALFEQEYREQIVRILDEQIIFGIDTSALTRRQRIMVSFISLYAERLESAGQNGDDTIISRVENVLVESSRLVILGVAGSGKTTLLKWIAVQSAAQGFHGPLSCCNGTIPFFIQLRQYLDSRFPAPEDFPRLTVPSIAGTMPNGWVHRQLNSGRAFILVDGVDEVPATRRCEVHSWLQELVGAFPNNRYIVTSRHYAIEDKWMLNYRFHTVELQPMDLADISLFIDYWHNSIKSSIGSQYHDQDPDEYAKKLKNDIQSSLPILNLAKNPLLCALICAMNWDTQGTLPKDRIDLYSKGCTMLLHLRAEQKRLNLPDYPHIELHQKLSILQNLAYYMVINNWNPIQRELAIDCIDRNLVYFDTQKYTPKNFIDFFIHRASMLREPQAVYLEFTHRTFQDYLAAKEVLNLKNIGMLINKAFDDQWYEIIILVAGMAPIGDREYIIKGLIEQGDKEGTYGHKLYLLAAACLELSSTLTPDLRNEVQKRLTRLLPPTNIAEAKAFASAGELAVTFLSNHHKEKAKIAASCIRALSMIGGRSALQALVNYCQDKRIQVIKELLRAADFFEINDFSEQILSKLIINKLRLEKAYSLDIVGKLTNLRIFSVEDASGVESIAPLINLKKLNFLRLRRLNRLIDISPIAQLSHLKKLHLIGAEEHLRKEQSIISDTTSNFRKINLFSALISLSQINFLNLSGFDSVTNIKPIKELNKLRTLCLRYMNRLTNIIPLGEMESLSILTLGNLDKVIDFKPLGKLKHLIKLGLYDLNIIDISFLNEMKSLKQLFIDESIGEHFKTIIEHKTLTSLNGIPIESVRRHYRDDTLKKCFEDVLVQKSANFYIS